jgi:hypothetical protein
VAAPAGAAGVVAGGVSGLVTGNDANISDVWGIINGVIQQPGG